MTRQDAQEWAEGKMYEEYKTLIEGEWRETDIENQYQALFKAEDAEYVTTLEPYPPSEGDWVIDVYMRIRGFVSVLRDPDVFDRLV
jgi:hypothetical protein